VTVDIAAGYQQRAAVIGASFHLYRGGALGPGGQPDAWHGRDRVAPGGRTTLPHGERVTVPAALRKAASAAKGRSVPTVT
jgi:hypothetical protein